MKVKAFENKLWLASPTMHGEELEYIKAAYETNWMSTVGENIDQIEKQVSAYIGVSHAVALSCGTAALHLAVKLAAERLYHSSTGSRTADGKSLGGALCGKRVFCSDLTFAATVNPIVYEGGEPIFIDSEYETWNMDPRALERAFEMYPDVKLVVLAHLYGTPAKITEIKRICEAHDALLIEDAAESLGAVFEGRQTGIFGDYAVVSFNGNKIITGSSGGILLTNDKYAAEKARKWSTQSREQAPWYQHEELGYNYRMSNVIAGVVRGQFLHLQEHIEKKKEIYEMYQEGFRDLPVTMNPYDSERSTPNFWLSCLLINSDAMCTQVRGNSEANYQKEKGKSCPTEILEALAEHNAEGRPVWKPMHMQPVFEGRTFVTKRELTGVGASACVGNENVVVNAEVSVDTDGKPADVGADIFARGLCLPSDIKMTAEQQNRVIEIVRNCFQ